MTDLVSESEIAESIVTKYFGPVASTPTKLEGGTVNKVFAVSAADQKLVIRFQDDPARFTEYDKENWCVEQARLLGVPTVDALKIGKYGDVVFVIQRYIEGRLGTETAEYKGHIWSTLGGYSAQLHSIQTKGFGLELVDPQNAAFSESWETYLKHNIESLGSDDPLISRKYINSAESSFLKGCFEELQQLNFQLGLCHGDVALRNTIIGTDKQVHLIDWGCALSDVVPYSEFAKILRFEKPSPKEFNSYLSGYGLSPAEFAEMNRTVAHVGLLRATDTLRWAIDHNYTANKKFLAGLRWSMRIAKGTGDWFTLPYTESFASDSWH